MVEQITDNLLKKTSKTWKFLINTRSHKISIFYTWSQYIRFILAEKISKLKTHNKELNITPINFYPLNKLYSMILENLDSISQSRYPEIKSTATFIFSQCNKNAL